MACPFGSLVVLIICSLSAGGPGRCPVTRGIRDYCTASGRHLRRGRYGLAGGRRRIAVSGVSYLSAGRCLVCAAVHYSVLGRIVALFCMLRSDVCLGRLGAVSARTRADWLALYY